LRTTHGDYDRWFARALAGRCELDLRQIHLGQELPDARDYDAIIMTGSPLSVTAPTDWMKRAGAYLRESGENGTPVLGVCFGHQLLGYAYGTKVIRNPRGREIGTVRVALTQAGRADPLFKGLPAELDVNATHQDVVGQLPDGAVVLASNENTPLQAMAFGRHIRGIQFHPELDEATVRGLIQSRREKLEAESLEPKGQRVTRLLAAIRATPFAERVLHNFVEQFT
jgi:GMP synthase (glutamine-hydrolysing)